MLVGKLELKQEDQLAAAQAGLFYPAEDFGSPLPKTQSDTFIGKNIGFPSRITGVSTLARRRTSLLFSGWSPFGENVPRGIIIFPRIFVE